MKYVTLPMGDSLTFDGQCLQVQHVHVEGAAHDVLLVPFDLHRLLATTAWSVVDPNLAWLAWLLSCGDNSILQKHLETHEGEMSSTV